MFLLFSFFYIKKWLKPISFYVLCAHFTLTVTVNLETKLLDSLPFETAFNRLFLPMPTRNVAIFVSNSTNRMVAYFAILQFENLTLRFSISHLYCNWGIQNFRSPPPPPPPPTYFWTLPLKYFWTLPPKYFWTLPKISLRQICSSVKMKKHIIQGWILLLRNPYDI